MSDKSPTAHGTQLRRLAFSSTPYTDATKLQVNTERIPRPMNSFMLWAKEERPRVRTQYPEYNNAQISQILGMEWKAMPTERKMVYQKRATELRKFHSLEFPSYKYRPRKRMPKAPKLEGFRSFPADPNRRLETTAVRPPVCHPSSATCGILLERQQRLV
ncbi:HMG box domain containing protein [Trichuris trichiura]|uniref:Sex-determining region Y protein n=1 Tax=Trichuris trichiura TaxID=36087 RepID=A0A077ZKG9_TRITR|nr:HMG box domain containing protein [Trichuris trichiura]